MPSFIARIELEAASVKDYQKLEEELKKASFKDMRKGRMRNSAPEVPVEFNKHASSLLEVTDAATKAARKTGRKYSFTVIKERKTSVN